MNPLFHSRSKHIELNYHFVKEKLSMDTIVTRYVSTHSQFANIFTKSLSNDVFTMFRGKLEVHIHFHFSLRRHVKGNIQEDTRNQVHKG